MPELVVPEKGTADSVDVERVALLPPAGESRERNPAGRLGRGAGREIPKRPRLIDGRQDLATVSLFLTV